MIIGSNAGTGLRRVKFACVKFGIPLFNSRVGSYGGPFRSLAKGNGDKSCDSLLMNSNMFVS